MSATAQQIGGLSLAMAHAQLAPWPTPAPPIQPQEYQQRLAQARALLRAQGADALLIGAGASLRYFTGVAWGASERLVAMLLTAEGDPLLICPAFEEGSLDAVLRIPVRKRLWEEHEDPHGLVAEALSELGAQALALDPGIAFAVHSGLSAVLGRVAIRDATPIVDGCRMRKSAAELALMQQACDMTLQVQRLAAGLIHEGITTAELVRFIDQAHRALGADNGSTFCIVQFGYATAYPHGIPGVQALRAGELVLIDTGCTVHGYHSDITRTYIFGEPSEKQRRIWQLEHDAQAAAFAAVRPGVSCAAVDQAAREVLQAAGLGPDYRLPGLPHRTGHGCGMSIHEAPYLVRGNALPLAPGMCCSNEPMIVVPGEFGVRLEDHFYVTEHGAQWFTPPSPAIDRPFA
ncbi:X-Pro dipeptidase [Xanthomonas translucens pv. arrhenatheri]|jgi:Xaa-Pro dipeptidase|uniref:Proline dipeptidase n=3 Tax=Xanthomonas graminis TaxID=3390026 RepID=A0A0K2ZGM2_9XANT|nr:Xaa-Pro peptidase family protein [Xanthomonas translucens]EKU25553.1 Putative proline dipeptidase [Xanthomonas translucens pv. graminis ART-Xtg29]OAX62889.1 X-Pro dipeptidase [Xanthomonas translucens pv. graminis]OAX64865.1 X-Pro dipeptidase [Xanthomonas translucens pv. arrhenatheri]UKE55490.1 Xaa-Pro peptidase family protein [Xanthomonas translucens pv. graminis]UKE63580.1 Xaa-Pro peptidase family protein [Xanthomonas translucens pv. poae]